MEPPGFIQLLTASHQTTQKPAQLPNGVCNVEEPHFPENLLSRYKTFLLHHGQITVPV